MNMTELEINDQPSKSSTQKRAAHGIVVVIGFFLLFQNCGRFDTVRFADTAVRAQESGGGSRYQSLLKLAMDPEIFSAWFSKEGTEIVQTGPQVSELKTRLSDGVSFSTMADTLSPQLVPRSAGTTVSRSMLHFSGKSSLQSPYNDNLGAGSYAVAAVVGKASQGRLILLKTDHEGDSLAIYLEGDRIRAEHVTDSLNSKVARFRLNKIDDFVLAITMGPEPDSMRVFVDGVLAEVEEEVKGTPQFLPYVWRQAILGDSEQDIDLSLGEFMIFRNSLSDAELNAISFMLAERAGIPEVQFDERLSQARPGGYGDQLPSAIRGLIEDKCFSCHQSSGVLWTLTIPGLTTAGVLKIGKPDESSLYIRLISTDPTKRMPVGSSLPGDEIELIRSWIQGL